MVKIPKSLPNFFVRFSTEIKRPRSIPSIYLRQSILLRPHHHLSRCLLSSLIVHPAPRSLRRRSPPFLRHRTCIPTTPTLSTASSINISTHIYAPIITTAAPAPDLKPHLPMAAASSLHVAAPAATPRVGSVGHKSASGSAVDAYVRPSPLVAAGSSLILCVLCVLCCSGEERARGQIGRGGKVRWQAGGMCRRCGALLSSCSLKTVCFNPLLVAI